MRLLSTRRTGRAPGLGVRSMFVAGTETDRSLPPHSFVKQRAEYADRANSCATSFGRRQIDPKRPAPSRPYLAGVLRVILRPLLRLPARRDLKHDGHLGRGPARRRNKQEPRSAHRLVMTGRVRMKGILIVGAASTEHVDLQPSYARIRRPLAFLVARSCS